MGLNLTETEFLIKDNPDEAVKVGSRALDDDPDDPVAMYAVCKGLVALDRGGMARIVCEETVRRNPQDPAHWCNLGNAYQLTYDIDKAEEALLRAVRLDPRCFPALNNLSLLYVNMADPERALSFARKALNVWGPNHETHENMGFALLMKKQWEEGWKNYNSGLGRSYNRKERSYCDPTEPRWDGTKGLTVVAYGEQGHGDEISFASAIPDLKRDANVIIECATCFEGLFKRSFDVPVYGTRYRSNQEWPKDHKIDARVAFGSLMEFYRNKTEDFPGEPYLIPDPERRKWWRAILDTYPGKKVGLAWTGGTTATGRKKRSLKPEDLKPILGDDTFVSLEYRDASEDLEKLNEWGKVLDFSRYLNPKDYDDTAALVAELDHVISATTAVVDLCGAIGKSCDVFVPSQPHWRYGLEGEMPWYKSVKLFRQLEGESWSRTVRRFVSMRPVESTNQT